MQNKIDFKIMEYEDNFLFNLNNFVKLVMLFSIYSLIIILPFYISFAFVLILSIVCVNLGFKVKPLVGISILIFLFSLMFGLYGFFLYEYESYVITINNFTFHYDFLVVTLNLFIKSFIIVTPVLIYSLTSTITQIEYGLETFFKPLYKIKFPVGIITLTASLTIGFVPILIREANRILISQAVRGRDITILSYKDKVTTIILMLIPLLVSSFVKAQQLSYSIEIRKYDPFKLKTYYTITELTRNEKKFSLITFLFTLTICSSYILYLIYT